MKYIRITAFIGMLFFMFSNDVNAQKEIFLKQIDFELARISDIDYENEFFLTLKLTKGTKYTFEIINGINNRPGEAILELLDADNLVMSNIFAEKYFETVNFQCNKTSFYDVLVRFKDNELGHCQINVTMVQ